MAHLVQYPISHNGPPAVSGKPETRTNFSYLPYLQGSYKTTCNTEMVHVKLFKRSTAERSSAEKYYRNKCRATVYSQMKLLNELLCADYFSNFFLFLASLVFDCIPPFAISKYCLCADPATATSDSISLQKMQLASCLQLLSQYRNCFFSCCYLLISPLPCTFFSSLDCP